MFLSIAATSFDIKSLILATVVVSVIGLLIGLFLGLASKKQIGRAHV